MYSLFQMLYLYSKIILKLVQLNPKRQLMYESHSQGADADLSPLYLEGRQVEKSDQINYPHPRHWDRR